jgi:hypothetical protein
MVVQASLGSEKTLYFGSAVVARRRGGLNWQFGALMAIHSVYSRVLLSVSAGRIARVRTHTR